MKCDNERHPQSFEVMRDAYAELRERYEVLLEWYCADQFRGQGRDVVEAALGTELAQRKEREVER